jgi:serine-type D-Ala-D-Ala carboxypeptidase/endopeptidase (penicillin-binding protein 4)
MSANAHSEGPILRRGDRRHPQRQWLRRLIDWLPVVVVLALLGSSAAVVQWNLGERWFGIVRADPQSNPGAVAPPSGVVFPAAVSAPALGVPVPTGDAEPDAVRRALAERLRDPQLGGHVVALVGSLDGGAPVFTSGTGRVAPASSLKLLTTTAALEALGPATTFDTTVVRGATARDVVLVGGGDPYLASKPDHSGDDYPPSADLTTLAQRTAAALTAAGVARVHLSYDDSLFTGPALSPHWPDDYLTDSVITPISALWVDHGVEADGFHRSKDPARQAADVFAEALAKAGIKPTGEPTRSRAPAGATRIARVQGATLDQVVQEILEVSDNEGAEVLLRQVGLAVEGQASFTAGVRAVRSTLQSLGVEVAGLQSYDGSGLSRDDRLSPRTLFDVLTLAASSDHPELRAVIEGLPVAAFSGSLEDRFAEGSAAGRGWVRAKTGTLTGISALAGLAEDADGVLLAFVIVADRVNPLDTDEARAALDSAASALAACHCSS